MQICVIWVQNQNVWRVYPDESHFQQTRAHARRVRVWSIYTISVIDSFSSLWPSGFTCAVTVNVLVGYRQSHSLESLKCTVNAPNNSDRGFHLKAQMNVGGFFFLALSNVCRCSSQEMTVGNLLNGVISDFDTWWIHHGWGGCSFTTSGRLFASEGSAPAAPRVKRVFHEWKQLTAHTSSCVSWTRSNPQNHLLLLLLLLPPPAHLVRAPSLLSVTDNNLTRPRRNARFSRHLH